MKKYVKELQKLGIDATVEKSIEYIAVKCPCCEEIRCFANQNEEELINFIERIKKVKIILEKIEELDD